MRFTHFLKNTVVISRMTAVSGDKIALTTVTSAKVHLQPLTLQQSTVIGGVYGKVFKIWCDSSLDFEDGDQLKDENGDYYKIRKGAVTSRSFGSIDYKELIIEKTK